MTDAQLVEILMATMRTQLRQPSLQFDPMLELKSLPDYDSVSAIQIVLGLEETFRITVDEDEIETLMTLGDAYRIVRNRLMAIA